MTPKLPKATVASWDGNVEVTPGATGSLRARIADHWQELVVEKHHLPTIRLLVEGDPITWALAEAICERVKLDASQGGG